MNPIFKSNKLDDQRDKSSNNISWNKSIYKFRKNYKYSQGVASIFRIIG